MRERLDAFLADVRDRSVVEDALAQLAGALNAEGERSRGRGSATSDEDVGVVAKQ